MALHAQTRQLAEHGPVRTRHLVVPVSRSAYPRPANPHRRSRRMAGRPKQTPRQSGLALHLCPRTGEAEEAIPRVMNHSGYSSGNLLRLVVVAPPPSDPPQPGPISQASKWKLVGWTAAATPVSLRAVH